MAGTVWIAKRRQGDADRRKLQRMERALPRAAWMPEDGNVLWWSFPVQEVPYVGTPLDEAFPDHCTHWTPFVIPSEAAR